MSKWDGNEAGFRSWLAERIATITCKPYTTTTSVHKFDPNIARFERWKRERKWIYGWYETNAHRPTHIDLAPPADWFDLVETQPLQSVSLLDTGRIPTIYTDQMSPISRPVPITDPIPKVTAILPADQAEYRIASVSLRENMRSATRSFYAKNKAMPGKIFLSPFNFAVASTQDIIQEAKVKGLPVMFFVYADLFLVTVEEYSKLSDQTILCWQ